MCPVSSGKCVIMSVTNMDSDCCGGIVSHVLSVNSLILVGAFVEKVHIMSVYMTHGVQSVSVIFFSSTVHRIQ